MRKATSNKDWLESYPGRVLITEAVILAGLAGLIEQRGTQVDVAWHLLLALVWLCHLCAYLTDRVFARNGWALNQNLAAVEGVSVMLGTAVAGLWAGGVSTPLDMWVWASVVAGWGTFLAVQTASDLETDACANTVSEAAIDLESNCLASSPTRTATKSETPSAEEIGHARDALRELAENYSELSARNIRDYTNISPAALQRLLREKQSGERKSQIKPTDRLSPCHMVVLKPFRDTVASETSGNS